MKLTILRRVEITTNETLDDATVFMIKGNSYRGKSCETIALSAGEPSALPKSKI